MVRVLSDLMPLDRPLDLKGELGRARQDSSLERKLCYQSDDQTREPRQKLEKTPGAGSLALWACRCPGIVTGVSEWHTLAVRQTSHVLDSDTNSLRSPYIRLSLVLGHGERPETVQFMSSNGQQNAWQCSTHYLIDCNGCHEWCFENVKKQHKLI